MVILGVRSMDFSGFDASNRVAMLSHRPRSAQGWEPKWGVRQYVWSTPSTPLWDWAAGTIHADLDRPEVEEIRQRLHPGEPVDRDPILTGADLSGARVELSCSDEQRSELGKMEVGH